MYRIDKNKDGQAEKTVVFTYAASADARIALAGSFNDWDPAAAVMTFSAESGLFEYTLQLPCGSYEYKMVVDGDWVIDENNPNFTANDFGTLNSVLIVN